MSDAGGPTYLDARPTIEVEDLPAAISFFTDVAGFAVEVSMGEPPVFAILVSGDTRVAVLANEEPASPAGAAVYFTVRGLDAIVDRAERAGVYFLAPITVRPWGLRDAVIFCPGGGPQLAFGEPIDELADPSMSVNR